MNEEQVGLSEKEIQWRKFREAVDGLGDRLGYRVDPGIRDTVAAFNANGFHTSQSCEGHLNRAIAAPWIDIEDPDGDKLWDESITAYEIADKAMESKQPQQVTDALYERALEKRKGANRPMLIQAKKIADILSEFYRDRETSYDRQLILNIFGNSCRIQSLGASLQEAADDETKSRNLEQYQAEMRAFTDHLKLRFFNSM